MSRIAETFAALKRDHRRGFIPFITAGDPDLETTLQLIIELAKAGATLIELGVPFTDPMADGPVIQRASERALKHCFGLAEIFQIVTEARKQTGVPIILFSYFNPLLQFSLSDDVGRTSPPSKHAGIGLEAGLVPPNTLGFEKLARAAKAAGVDGILVTDLVPEEAGEFAAALLANDLDMIFLVAPTSTDERLQMVAARASGFIYAVSRAGITGARDEMSSEAERLVGRVRRFSDLPVAVGFGISTPEQVADVWRYADAAVVGSAIVAEIEKASSTGDVVSRIGQFVRELISD
ncbi:MAG: tryptophan synthase alpha chain [Blastocatellia bacterium]|jgi:tryptophan synthase alpha chain|nr:tryptophan synthase alpha chain [Blastocatellia bacterium]